MSKRNRSRFADLPDPKDSRQNSTENKTPQTSKPVVIDDTLDDEGNSLVDFSKIGAFFAGCWKKTATFFQSAGSKTWNGCRSAAQWTWKGLRKIPSYCTIRWDSENEAEPTNSAPKPEPLKAASKPESKACTAPDKIGYDEDELPSSRWWSLGIKSAAAVAALAILAGGYFAAKPFLLETPAEVAEANVENTDLSDSQTQEGMEQDTASVENFSVAAVPGPVQEPVFQPIPQPIPEPVIASPAVAADFPTVPEPPQQFDVTALGSQPQGSAPNDDPFSVHAIAPEIAGTAPPFANDSLNPIPAAFPEQPEPVAAVTPSLDYVVTNIPDPPAAALQPLAQLGPTTIASPQLQPLVALNASALPSAAVAVPRAATASANAPVAANRNPTARRGSTNPAFSEAPIVPSVNTLPQTTIERTISVAEPVREITPQIPPSGTVENVPPPIVPPPLVEAPVIARVMPTEPVPAIPGDLPESASPPVVVVPARTPATETELQILSSDTQPMDMQLWEHIHELQSESRAEPSNLQLEGVATSEPALRFTPRETAAPTSEGDTLMSAATEQFRGLQLTDELSPAANDIALALPELADAPQPVFSVPRPAYRDNQNESDSERGMTFQNRIDSETSRSPLDTTTYVIQRGDTYMTISDKFYGTSLLYAALAEHNQKLGIGWRPAEGVVIEIPTAEYLRTHYGTAAVQQQASRLEAQRSAVRYVVQEGDTVFRLATDKLRDTNRWREIYSMNADRIQDVRSLQPGTEILLPL